MSSRRLAKEDWKSYFDDYSKHIQSERVELDVMALDVGDQIAEDFVALNGISYDPKADAIYIFTEAMRHYILHPEGVLVFEGKGRVESVEVEDSEGVKHQVILRDASEAGGDSFERQMKFGDLEAIP